MNTTAVNVMAVALTVAALLVLAWLVRTLGAPHGHTPGGVGSDAASRAVRASGREIDVFDVTASFDFYPLVAYERAMDSIGDRPLVIIFRLRSVQTLGPRGVRTLVEVISRFRRRRRLVILCEVSPIARAEIDECEVMADVGEDLIAHSLAAAVSRAQKHLEHMHA